MKYVTTLFISLLVAVSLCSGSLLAADAERKSIISGSVTINLDVGKISNILTNANDGRGKISIGHVKKSDVNGLVKIEQIKVDEVVNELNNTAGSSATVNIGSIHNAIVKDATFQLDVDKVGNTITGGSDNHGLVNIGSIKSSYITGQVNIGVRSRGVVTNKITGGRGNRSEVSIGSIVNDADMDLGDAYAQNINTGLLPDRIAYAKSTNNPSSYIKDTTKLVSVDGYKLIIKKSNGELLAVKDKEGKVHRVKEANINSPDKYKAWLQQLSKSKKSNTEDKQQSEKKVKALPRFQVLPPDGDDDKSSDYNKIKRLIEKDKDQWDTQKEIKEQLKLKRELDRKHKLAVETALKNASDYERKLWRWAAKNADNKKDAAIKLPCNGSSVCMNFKASLLAIQKAGGLGRGRILKEFKDFLKKYRKYKKRKDKGKQIVLYRAQPIGNSDHVTGGAFGRMRYNGSSYAKANKVRKKLLNGIDNAATDKEKVKAMQKAQANGDNSPFISTTSKKAFAFKRARELQARYGRKYEVLKIKGPKRKAFDFEKNFKNLGGRTSQSRQAKDPEQKEFGIRDVKIPKKGKSKSGFKIIKRWRNIK